MALSTPTDNAEQKNMMKAWTFNRRGFPTTDTLKIANLSKPSASSLRKNEILVKVHYAGIWPLYSRAIMSKFPHFTSNSWYPEMAYSGVVEAVGTAELGSTPTTSSDHEGQDEQFRVGDEVFGSQDLLNHIRYGGTTREYMTLPASLVAKKPQSLSLKEAAALGGNACTAVQFLDILNLPKGANVLVTGASGSLATMVVPALRATLGDQANIVGVSSGAKQAMVKDLGANLVINYQTTSDLSAHLTKNYATQPFDAIIDIAGNNPNLYSKAPQYLRKEGTYLFAGMIGTTHGQGGLLSLIWSVLLLRIKINLPVFLGGVPRKTVFHPAKINQSTLRRVREWVGKGWLKVSVTKVWAMSELLDAYKEFGLRGAEGRTVLQIHE